MYRPNGDEPIFDGELPIETFAERKKALGNAAGKAVFVVGRHLAVPSATVGQVPSRIHLRPLRTNSETGMPLDQLRTPEIDIGLLPEDLSRIDIVQHRNGPDGCMGVASLVLRGLVLSANQLERQAV